MKGKGFGLSGNIVVGCIGAVPGGFLFELLDIAAYGLIGALIIALTGALVFIPVARLIKK